jgi:hypothetical protein
MRLLQVQGGNQGSMAVSLDDRCHEEKPGLQLIKLRVPREERPPCKKLHEHAADAPDVGVERVPVHSEDRNTILVTGYTAGSGDQQ